MYTIISLISLKIFMTIFRMFSPYTASVSSKLLLSLSRGFPQKIGDSWLSSCLRKTPTSDWMLCVRARACVGVCVCVLKGCLATMGFSPGSHARRFVRECLHSPCLDPICLTAGASRLERGKKTEGFNIIS